MNGVVKLDIHAFRAIGCRSVHGESSLTNYSLFRGENQNNNTNIEEIFNNWIG